jgi:hypothetical protein
VTYDPSFNRVHGWQHPIPCQQWQG